MRLVARATGSRAATPADVRQATAVIPAERRCGTTTPCPPNAPAERTTAPRLRGSVTPSSATIRPGVGRLRGDLEELVGMRVLVGRHGERDALVQRAARDPVEVAAGHLQDRHARLGGQVHGLGDAFVGRAAHRDRERQRGDALRAGTRPRGCGRARSRWSRRRRGGGARPSGGPRPRAWRCARRPRPWRARGGARRAAWGPCPPTLDGAGRRSRRPSPSSCLPCAPRRGAWSCLPWVLCVLQ